MSRASDPHGEHDVLERILRRLSTASGIDLRGYRRATLQRRVLWRMTAQGIDTMQAFLERLERDDDEARRSAAAMLVGTTSMFRDAELFDELGGALARLVAERRSAGAGMIRCWVAACSTGAEAFSLGICLADATERTGPDWRIWATDIDTAAIEAARLGHVPTAKVPADLPAKVTRRLQHTDVGAVVDAEIRRRIRFSIHDVLNDRRLAPPEAVVASFDVVSCRNLLIYLDDETQSALCARLLKACAPGALLVLGRAERLPSFLLDEVTAVSTSLPLYRVR